MICMNCYLKLGLKSCNVIYVSFQECGKTLDTSDDGEDGAGSIGLWKRRPKAHPPNNTMPKIRYTYIVPHFSRFEICLKGKLFPCVWAFRNYINVSLRRPTQLSLLLLLPLASL